MAPTQLSEKVPAASTGDNHRTSLFVSSIFTSMEIGLPVTDWV